MTEVDIVLTAPVSVAGSEKSTGKAVAGVTVKFELSVLHPFPFESILKTSEDVLKYEPLPPRMYPPSAVLARE